MLNGRGLLEGGCHLTSWNIGGCKNNVAFHGAVKGKIVGAVVSQLVPTKKEYLPLKCLNVDMTQLWQG